MFPQPQLSPLSFNASNSFKSTAIRQFAARAGYRKVSCLPNTHSHWKKPFMRNPSERRFIGSNYFLFQSNREKKPKLKWRNSARLTSAQPMRWIASLGSSSAWIRAWLRSIRDSRAPGSFWEYDCPAVDILCRRSDICVDGRVMIGDFRFYKRGAFYTRARGWSPISGLRS